MKFISPIFIFAYFPFILLVAVVLDVMEPTRH